jgi:hypothetical protein
MYDVQEVYFTRISHPTTFSHVKVILHETYDDC